MPERKDALNKRVLGAPVQPGRFIESRTPQIIQNEHHSNVSDLNGACNSEASILLVLTHEMALSSVDNLSACFSLSSEYLSSDKTSDVSRAHRET